MSSITSSNSTLKFTTIRVKLSLSDDEVSSASLSFIATIISGAHCCVSTSLETYEDKMAVMDTSYATVCFFICCPAALTRFSLVARVKVERKQRGVIGPLFSSSLPSDGEKAAGKCIMLCYV